MAFNGFNPIRKLGNCIIIDLSMFGFLIFLLLFNLAKSVQPNICAHFLTHF